MFLALCAGLMGVKFLECYTLSQTILKIASPHLTSSVVLNDSSETNFTIG